MSQIFKQYKRITAVCVAMAMVSGLAVFGAGANDSREREKKAIDTLQSKDAPWAEKDAACAQKALEKLSERIEFSIEE